MDYGSYKSLMSIESLVNLSLGKEKRIQKNNVFTKNTNLFVMLIVLYDYVA
jgi:hypothetical protein